MPRQRTRRSPRRRTSSAYPWESSLPTTSSRISNRRSCVLLHVRNDWLAILARIGLVAKGVSFAIVGVLAFELALGRGGKSTSREGALATIADESWGELLLLALAAGFAAYALWRVAQAVFERDDEESKRWAKRVGYLGRAAIYAGLTYSAIKLVTGPATTSSQNERAHKAAAQVLSWPAGTWLVGNRRRVHRRRRPLQWIPRRHPVVHRQVARRRPDGGIRSLGDAHRRGRPARAARCRRPHRRLRDQSCTGVRPERGDRARRGAAEAQPSELRAVAARSHRRRSRRVRDLLLRRRALPQSLIYGIDRAPRRDRLHRRRGHARSRDLRLAAACTLLRQLDRRLGKRDRTDPRLPLGGLLVRGPDRGPATRAHVARPDRPRCRDLGSGDPVRRPPVPRRNGS